MQRILPLLFLLLVLAPAAQAAPSQLSIIESPRELRTFDAGERARAYDDMKALGADMVRINLFWRDVAPAAGSAERPAFDERDPAAYAFSHYEEIVADARKRGLKVMLTITGPGPVWSTRDKRDGVSRPLPAHFGAFATAVGRNFPQVKHWSIYNEPNHPLFLQPQYVKGKPVSGKLYRGLYLAGKRGLNASGHRRDTVLMGETAPFETKGLVSPLTFLRQALAGKRTDVDGWAHHPYSGVAQAPSYRSNNPANVTIASIDRLERALDKAARQGKVRRNLPIWVTEYGVQSTPDPNAPSLANQNLFRTIAERMAYRNPRIKAFAQYLVRDDLPKAPSGPNKYGDFESGLRFAGGRKKPSFNGYRLPLTADRAGRRVKFWGLVRPASGRTTATLQVKRGGWKTLRKVRTNRHGAFDVKVRTSGSRAYRLKWKSFKGAQMRPR